MTTTDRLLLCICVFTFVVCWLATVAPHPRDPVNGDYKMINAIAAAFSAAAVAWLVTS